MKHINQNLKKLNPEKSNLKKLNQKKLNPKNLAFIGVVAFGLAFGACFDFSLSSDSSLDSSNTSAPTDTLKRIYHPQNRDELVQLLKDENIKLDTIDTSKIKDMSLLFAKAKIDACNELSEDSANYENNCKNAARDRKDFSGIEGWDTSSVEDMTLMFAYIKSLNQSLESWDVSSVKNMQGMFFYAQSFNQPLDKWNVGNVENMQEMFKGAESFRQNLNAWDTRNVKEMFLMFEDSPLESNPPKWEKKWSKQTGIKWPENN